MKTRSKSARPRTAINKFGKAKKGTQRVKKALANTRWLASPGGNPRVLAVAPEGTEILKPNGKPMKFNVNTLKRAIATVTSEV
jgi:hypothetical protein